MKGDTLSDVLRSVRLLGATLKMHYFGDKWAMKSRPTARCGESGVDGPCRTKVYVVTRGAVWLGLPGQASKRLQEGDIVVLLRDEGSQLSSAPGTYVPSAMLDMSEEQAASGAPAVTGSAFSVWGEVHAEAAKTIVVSGVLAFEKRLFAPLLACLPRMLHVSAADGAAWIAPLMEQVLLASSKGLPGSEAMLDRIAETMLIDVVRRHVDRLPLERTGWLAGLHDRQLGKALALIHEEPARAWTVGALASAAGLSRSVLYERCERLLGQSPMQYLTQWRIHVAGSMLRSGGAPVSAIALDVGYESEAAFSRAFKRLLGSPPARWRKQQDDAASLLQGS